jgi:hypothetical protein
MKEKKYSCDNVKPKGSCFNCKKMGRVITKCIKKIATNNKSQANITSSNKTSGIQLFTICLNIGSNFGETWYLDFGASQHMTPHKKLFYDKNIYFSRLLVYSMGYQQAIGHRNVFI